jgi:Holliday junction resolvase RusA-like endonuclease
VGRGVMIESSQLVKPWREAVVWAARERNIKVSGPVSVRVVFTIRKPVSAPKKRKTYPDKKPDLDKLLRSTLDALVTAGAIEDDARVIRLSSSKVFPREDALALDVPGAFIEIVEVA